MIEGGFTYDALPDLFRYLCSRQESLLWQLSTLAGTFSMVFEHGQPTDVMFRPIRPTGARVGLKALQILFRQQGGEFSVHRDPPAVNRRTLHSGGEQLLIEMATLDDEKVAPAVLAGRMIDTSSELAAVKDLAPRAHRTAFRTHSADMPLGSVLQLFSFSHHSYQIGVYGTGGFGTGGFGTGVSVTGAHGEGETLIGRIVLNAATVLNAAAGKLQGEEAFVALLNLRREVGIQVVPVLLEDSKHPEETPEVAPLGKLDLLLLRAVMAGGGQGLEAQVGGSLDTFSELATNMDPEPSIQKLNEQSVGASQDTAGQDTAGQDTADQDTAGRVSMLGRMRSLFRK